MEPQLDTLRRAAAPLEPDAATRAAWLDQVAAFAADYLARVPRDPVFLAQPAGGRGLAQAGLPAAGRPLDEVLSLFDREVLGNGINPTSGRFFGYIPGGGLYASALGDFLAAVTNRYAGVFFASPGAVRLENDLLRWMADEVVGFPASAAGNLASGGSVANLGAIVTARDAHGISGPLLPRSVVYSTVHAHHCIDKALHVAGLAGCVRRSIAVDDHYRMDAAALAEAIHADRAAGLAPWLVVASAGTTNSGAVDPLAEIADIAAAEALWLHVDGAYGAYFNLCPEGRVRLAPMARADSVVMDPHKTLFLPYGSGALLVRERTQLLASHGAAADYMAAILDAGDELSPADLSPELTRHFRGLRLWLPLQLAGVDAFRAALSEKIQLARAFHATMASEPGFEVGPFPDLSVVTYRAVPPRGDADEFNLALTRAIQQDGRIFVSETRLDGRVVLRLAVVCFRSHEADVELALDVIRATAATLAET
jgi:glutamate/tyrosine decarboxylase-like PLP-dependent enzyme